jgi:hypothetical protein
MGVAAPILTGLECNARARYRQFEPHSVACGAALAQF